MINIALEPLQPQITQRYQQCVRKNERSIESEIIAIPFSILILEQPQTEPLGLATAIQRHFDDDLSEWVKFSAVDVQRT